MSSLRRDEACPVKGPWHHGFFFRPSFFRLVEVILQVNASGTCLLAHTLLQSILHKCPFLLLFHFDCVTTEKNSPCSW